MNEYQPDQVLLTTLRAERLSKLTGVAVDELRGRPIIELSERLKWVIDSELLFFRRVCGQVVKTEPVTAHKRWVK